MFRAVNLPIPSVLFAMFSSPLLKQLGCFSFVLLTGRCAPFSVLAGDYGPPVWCW